MRPVYLYFFLGAMALSAQVPISPDKVQEADAAFEHHSDDRPLACHITPFRPTLSFSFRIQGGYFADVPLKQFTGPNQRLLVVLRVTPAEENVRPYYFLQRLDFPEVPEKTKAVAQLSGGLYFGEGRYTVDFLATDPQNRVCRKQWKVEAKRGGKERQLKVLQEPNTVESVVLPSWAGTGAAADPARPLRATIFLNVAPMRSRSLRLSVFDQALMFGTLKAVLEQSPFTSVRLVAFNLDRHKEIFRTDGLDARGFNQLRRAIHNTTLATIDMSVLREPQGHLTLLSKLVKEELESPAPADAVIFIGPNTRRQDRLPADWPTATGATPRFFYLEYSPMLAVTFPDVIVRAVRSFDGKWFAVHSPQELASALQKMERALASPTTAETTPAPHASR